MKVKTQKDTLLPVLTAAADVARKRSKDRPILQYVLLTAGDGEVLSVSANDGWVEYKGYAPALLGTDGAVCVGARELLAVIKGAKKGEDIVLEKADEGLRVSCEGMETVIAVREGEEFPQNTPVFLPQQLQISAETALRALAATTPFVYTVSGGKWGLDYTRPHEGVLFERRTDEGLRLVSTDMHRLALVEIDGELPPELPERIAPSSLLVAVQKTLRRMKKKQRAGEVVSFRFSPSHVGVEVGPHEWRAQLVGGEFPAYRSVLPVGAMVEWSAEVDQQAMVDAVKVIAAKENVRLVCTSEGLEIQSVKGKTKQHVPAQTSGGSAQVALQGKYILDALNSFHSPTVTISLHRPVGKTPVVLETQGQLHLIMPWQE